MRQENPTPVQPSPPSPAQQVAGFYVALPPVEQSSGMLVSELVGTLRKNLRWLLLCALVGLALGVTAFFVMRPLYRAQVLAVPVSNEGQGDLLSSLAGGLGGLARLGGIALPGARDEVAETVAVMRSRKFLADFITHEGLMPILFAEQWDAAGKAWRSREVKEQPTLQKAVDKFSRRVMNVEVDAPTRLITVTIDWHDRNAAAKWANNLVDRLNVEMRQRAIVEARRNIEYLNREGEKTQIVSLEQGISQLIEAEIQRAMLASTRTEYSLRVLDPAIAPEEDRYIRPNWPLLVVGGALFGFLFGAAMVLLLPRRLGWVKT